MNTIRIKRAYEPPAPDDGARILIDGIWPRGVTKKAAGLTLWCKEIAPSPALRKWFGHDPARWTEFQRRYRRELDNNRNAVEQLIDRLDDKPMTLVYGARDTAHNHAIVLADYIRRVLGSSGRPHRKPRSEGPA